VPTADRLWELAADVDLVVVASPNGTHVAFAEAAVRLGLATVVDKPLAPTAAEGARVVALAAERGVPLSVFANRRWDSDFLTLQKLIADGTLGTVHRFVSRIDRFRPVKPGWAGDPADGGGTLLDLGPHLIDQALHLFGPVTRLHAQVRAVRTGSGADDEIELHLEHAGGVFSTLAAGMASAAEGPRFQLEGSLGGYLLHGFDVQEAQLKAGENPETLGAAWGVEDASAYGTLTTVRGSGRLPTERGRWDTFYPAAAAAVRGTGPVPVDPADAVRTASIVDAARVSAAEHRVVEFASR